MEERGNGAHSNYPSSTTDHKGLAKAAHGVQVHLGRFRHIGRRARGIAAKAATKAGSLIRKTGKALHRDGLNGRQYVPSPRKDRSLRELLRKLPKKLRRKDDDDTTIISGVVILNDDEDEDNECSSEEHCNESTLTTDVQIVDVLYEDAPFDLRYLFWTACSRRTFHKFSSCRDAWMKMCSLGEVLEREQKGDSNRELMHDRDAIGTLEDDSLTARQREFDLAIRNDLDRIFPGHEYLDSQAMKDKVFSILRSYSMVDEEVGYCQGMAYMATLACLYLPERDAYGLLLELMGKEGCNLRSMYRPGLGALQLTLTNLEENMRVLIPKVFQRFKVGGVPSVLFATSWFLTLYAASFPLVMSCRIIDIMLSEGQHDILVRVALAMLQTCEKDLLQCTDTEEIIAYLKTKPLTWTLSQLRVILDRARQIQLLQPQISEGDGADDGGKEDDCHKYVCKVSLVVLKCCHKPGEEDLEEDHHRRRVALEIEIIHS